MAYAVSALLETPISGAPGGTDSENMNPNRMPNGQVDPNAVDNSLANVHGRLHDNFHIAYDALDLG
jgi:hypothetical protein